MNLLYVVFLSTIKSLSNFSNIVLPNQRQELITKSFQSSEIYEKLRYENFTVYSVRLRNERHISVFERLTNSGGNFDVWQNHGDKWHIMVNPNSLNYFKNLTKIGHLETEIIVENVQRLIDEELASQNRFAYENFGWKRYHTLDEIEAWIDNITFKYPKVTQTFTIGTSTEGRKIRGIKISYKAENPGIFIESHIHAREWITSATATWIINELLSSKRIRVRYMAENYDWYIVPVLNVDGFVYSHQTDRLWRKTRSHHSNNTKCVGVDGNRNYNSHWMENGGATSNPCDYTYAGPFPFSEPEIRGLANYVSRIKDKINILLAFHSYGQNLLSPFGYTSAIKPTNLNDLMQVANAFSEAVANLSYHTKYHYGTTAERLYIASGCTSDWAYEQGIRLTYTVEFRDQGQYGFLLPSSYIIPNSEEALTGLFAMIIKADSLGYMHLKYNKIPAKVQNNIVKLSNLFKWSNL